MLWSKFGKITEELRVKFYTGSIAPLVKTEKKVYEDVSNPSEKAERDFPKDPTQLIVLSQ